MKGNNFVVSGNVYVCRQTVYMFEMYYLLLFVLISQICLIK